MIFLWTISTLILTAIVVVECFPEKSPASFTKDFSANLDEVKQFGGDFLPKFEFEEFFKKVEETPKREGDILLYNFRFRILRLKSQLLSNRDGYKKWCWEMKYHNIKISHIPQQDKT
jgi:hypothetical protein